MFCKNCGQPIGEHLRVHHQGTYCDACRERAARGEPLRARHCPRCARLVFPNDIVFCDGCRKDLLKD